MTKITEIEGMSGGEVRHIRGARRHARPAPWGRLLVAFAIIVAVAVAFPAGAELSRAAGASGYDSKLNKVETWCPDGGFKIDGGFQGSTWISTGSYHLVVLKSALVNDSFVDVVEGQELATVSGKEISHAIVCTSPEVPPTTVPPTTVPPTTVPPTTVPPTTSTPGPTSTLPPTTTAGPPPAPTVPVPPVMPDPEPVPSTPSFTG